MAERSDVELLQDLLTREHRLLSAYEAALRRDAIDPAETRRKLVAGFELLRSKREELPKRKHGNVPL